MPSSVPLTSRLANAVAGRNEPVRVVPMVAGKAVAALSIKVRSRMAGPGPEAVGKTEAKFR